MQPLQLEANDNLLTAKIKQAHQENQHHRHAFPFKVSECIVLSTLHRKRAYKLGDELQAAKFMPRFNGPYCITTTDKRHSTVTLTLPEHSLYFPVFHTSEVKLFKENDDQLFPTCTLHLPEPISMDGVQEFFMDKIVDERR